MPYLLILLSLIFVSCKQQKTNALSEAGVKSHLEQSAFLTVKNTQATSFFRGKILNTFVEEKFPTGLIAMQMKNRDELKHYAMDDRSLVLYGEKEKNSAKVIVSYSDRSEVFFLPENIPLETLAASLNLKPEAHKVFKWVTTNTTKTFNGVVLYLVSMNLEDIVKNDQNYFNEVIDLKNEFAGKKIGVTDGVVLEFKIAYSGYQQAEVAQSFEGARISCRRESLESGECGKCSFQRSVPAGHYLKIENLPLSESGITLRLGERVYLLNEFNPVVESNGLKLTINASDYDLRNVEDSELMVSKLEALSKFSPNYGHSGYCPDRSGGSVIGLDRKVEASVLVTVRGRGTELLKDVF